MTFDAVDRASTDIESWSKERDRQVNHLYPVHLSKTFPFWYLCLPGFFRNTCGNVSFTTMRIALMAISILPMS
jgi:hypothetical protein